MRATHRFFRTAAMTFDADTASVFQEDSVAHLTALINDNSDWIWEVDAAGRYTYCSARVTQLLGHTPDDMIGRTPFDFMPPAEAERVAQVFGAIAGAARPFAGLVNRNLHADGHVVVLETSGVPIFDARGTLRGYRGIDRDISAVGERYLQLESVYATAPVALGTVDREGRFMLANQAMAGLFGEDAAGLQGRALAQLFTQGGQRMTQDFLLAEAGHPLPHHEFAWDGRWFFAEARPLADAVGRVIGLSVAWTDITRRKHAEQQLTAANQQLERYAQQDYLTGLYNRRYLDDRLAREIARALRNRQPLSLCMADVDFFKPYNDTQGHIAGDECLRAVAGALAQGAVRPGDVVSRYGGEEFVVVLCGTDAEGALVVAERLRAAVAALQLPHAGSPFGHVTASVGVVTCQPGPRTAGGEAAPCTVPELLRAADQALYAAKHQGRDRVAQQVLA